MSGEDTALLIDFGSTYTKIRAVDLDAGRIIGSGQGPSTVDTDVTVGLTTALDDLAEHLGGLPSFRYRLACSSAAGGLRMVTVGLVRELTAEAARLAALGAGAKLVGCFAYRLTASDVAEIERLSPDILLLAGGTDGGNTDVILANAEALAGTRISCPIVVAGNRAAADEVRDRLERAGKDVRVAGNVMPEFGVLDIVPARSAIRDVFLERIVHAKGIDKAGGLLDRVLMPTPAAVLEGAQLLAQGIGGQAGLGPLVVVDPGGATTDVHSVCKGGPSRPEIVQRGLPEPEVKRTVEGDLGMRHSAVSLAEAAGTDAIARESGLAADQVREMVEGYARNPDHLAETAEEQALDLALARAAVGLAVRRHAGTIETVYTAMGPAAVQHGKDLGEVGTIVGTGGILAHGPQPGRILETALFDPADATSLRPRRASLYLDRAYMLFACGLLREVAPEAALRLALNHIEPVEEEVRDGRNATA